MRHQVSGRKLGRTTSHRWALFRNMMESLIAHERIETTLHKAKELRSFADHMITLGKKDSLWARRQAQEFLRSKDMVIKLFAELAPRFKDRNGGYTRILKTGFRHGDSAPMAFIEYLPAEGKAGEKPEGKKAAAPKKAKKEAAPKAAKAPKAPKAKKEAAPKAEKAAKAKKAPAEKKAPAKKAAKSK